MSGAFLTFLAVLLFLAAQFRDPFAFTLLYFFGGVYLFSGLWQRRAIQGIGMTRRFTRRVFPGEKVQVELRIFQRGLLPVAWLHLQDGLPPQISPEGSFRRVISLMGRQARTLTYELSPRERGRYPVGPLRLQSGDFLGLRAVSRRELDADYLTVYPHIVRLPNPRLISQSPLGTLAHRLPIFEDPSRPIGKRPYQDGDSLRRMDWKASAATGRFQVRLYEPAIALGLMLALNLDARAYPLLSRRDASELGITVAASLAQWSIAHGQAAGLWAHGQLPADAALAEPLVPVQRGQAHAMHLLGVLAEIQSVEMTHSFADGMPPVLSRLPWGTTLAVITPQMDEALFALLFAARRRGLQVVLLMCGDVPGVADARARAATAGFPFFYVPHVRDVAAILGAGWPHSVRFP
ncbi:MAG: hypothetical protein Fur0018_02080 [Anaerolineales bacterium]